MASLRDIVSYPRRLRRAPPDAARGATLSDRELAEVVQAMRVCASGSGGDARALASAAALKASYERLSHGGRRQFLVIAATELGLDRDRLAETARTMLEATGDDRRTFEDALRAALESPWSRLLRQVNRLPGGTRFLVDVRADLLRLGRRHPVLRALEQDLRSLLQTWFDVGFLELRRVTWDSSASLLERLARSEAVHTVVGWDDLKNRLDTDRRLYACFHPHMPDDPLSFVEVALARGLPREIGPLLDQHAPTVDPGAADTAVFYSISSVERGLGGIPFGGFLIRKAVDELSAELPGLRTFATISPIPGFRTWLDRHDVQTLLRREELRELEPVLAAFAVDSLPRLLTRDWIADTAAVAALQRPLLRLCAVYLLHDAGPAADSVMRFHLSNGARLDRISWLGDRSARGLARSAGMMAHYVYERARLESNHEAFVTRHEIVAADAVKRLVRDRG